MFRELVSRWNVMSDVQLKEHRLAFEPSSQNFCTGLISWRNQNGFHLCAFKSWMYAEALIPHFTDIKQ